jgi:hypothetical protein
MHCFASAGAWNGGHWGGAPDNRALLLNLIGDAVAWRMPPAAATTATPPELERV